MKDTEVIAFNYYGNNPEYGAFNLFREWVLKNNLDITKEGLRIFGYNNPNPVENSDVYGYEVCITLNEKVKKQINKKDIKILKGGMYAIVTIKNSKNIDMGLEISKTWKRFGKWLETSKFQLSERQWLEEHHGFDEKLNHIGNVDLYMSVDYRDTKLDMSEIRDTAPFDTNVYTFKGIDAIDQGRKYSLEWLNTYKNDLEKTELPTYIFGSYDFLKEKNNTFVFELLIVVPKDIKVSGNYVRGKMLGGKVARRVVLFKDLDNSWNDLIKKYSNHSEYKNKNTVIFEQYLIEDDFTENMKVLQILELE